MAQDHSRRRRSHQPLHAREAGAECARVAGRRKDATRWSETSRKHQFAFGAAYDRRQTPDGLSRTASGSPGGANQRPPARRVHRAGGRGCAGCAAVQVDVVASRQGTRRRDWRSSESEPGRLRTRAGREGEDYSFSQQQRSRRDSDQATKVSRAWLRHETECCGQGIARHRGKRAGRIDHAQNYRLHRTGCGTPLRRPALWRTTRRGSGAVGGRNDFHCGHRDPQRGCAGRGDSRSGAGALRHHARHVAKAARVQGAAAKPPGRSVSRSAAGAWAKPRNGTRNRVAARTDRRLERRGAQSRIDRTDAEYKRRCHRRLAQSKRANRQEKGAAGLCKRDCGSRTQGRLSAQLRQDVVARADLARCGCKRVDA